MKGDFPPPHGMKIMVVDDEVKICNGVARFIRKRWPEVEVSIISNAIDALASIRHQLPDLLITDLRMPEMDGLELMQQARELDVQHSIVLTGYDEFDLMQQAIRLRAQDYLLKPVDKEQLFQAVETAWKNCCTAAVNAARLAMQYGVETDTPLWHEQLRLLFMGEKSAYLVQMTQDQFPAATFLSCAACWTLDSDEPPCGTWLLACPADLQQHLVGILDEQSIPWREVRQESAGFIPHTEIFVEYGQEIRTSFRLPLTVLRSIRRHWQRFSRHNCGTNQPCMHNYAQCRGFWEIAAAVVTAGVFCWHCASRSPLIVPLWPPPCCNTAVPNRPCPPLSELRAASWTSIMRMSGNCQRLPGRYMYPPTISARYFIRKQV